MSSTNKTVDVDMDGDKSVTAVFATTGNESYQITVNSNNPNGGQVRINGAWDRSATATVDKGTNVTIQAQGINGYTFIGWTGILAPTPIATFTAEKSMTIMANFKPPTYTMNISAETGGSASPTGTFSQPGGSSLRITAFADSGYDFDHWTVNGVNYSSPNYAATVSGNITARAYFVPKPVPTFDLTVEVGTGGVVTAMAYDPAQTLNVPAGGSGVLTDLESGEVAYLGAVTEEHFNLLFWEKVSGDGRFANAVTELDTTFQIGSSDATVRANFLEDPQLNLDNIDDILVDVEVDIATLSKGYSGDSWVPTDWGTETEPQQEVYLAPNGSRYLRYFSGWSGTGRSEAYEFKEETNELGTSYNWYSTGYRQVTPPFQQVAFMGTTSWMNAEGQHMNGSAVTRLGLGRIDRGGGISWTRLGDDYDYFPASWNEKLSSIDYRAYSYRTRGRYPTGTWQYYYPAGTAVYINNNAFSSPEASTHSSFVTEPSSMYSYASYLRTKSYTFIYNPWHQRHHAYFYDYRYYFLDKFRLRGITRHSKMQIIFAGSPPTRDEYNR